MVTGINGFTEWFKGYEEQYTIIGGTACDILMTEAELDFRATKDIDMVVIIEAVNADFGKRFWEYIKNGGYEHCNKSSGQPQFYRFTHPKSKEYPSMIELFSRKLDSFKLPDNAVLMPLPIDDEISSLSAILLDDDYYELLRQGRRTIEGVSILDAAYLIPFKAKAWLDLSNRKLNGEQVNSKNIRKHKNDIFRLSDILEPDIRINVSEQIYSDINEFINKIHNEDINLSNLGIRDRTKDEILNELSGIYINDK